MVLRIMSRTSRHSKESQPQLYLLKYKQILICQGKFDKQIGSSLL